MTTILKETMIEGHGLMKNKPCSVKFFPSKTGKIRYFVNGQDFFEADVDNVLSTDHCVVLGNKKSKAMLTEHLSAALAFCGIDSIDICMDEMEVPALDGSSKQWVELFKNAGIEKHLFEKKQYYTVKEPVYYINGKTSLVVFNMPANVPKPMFAVDSNGNLRPNKTGFDLFSLVIMRNPNGNYYFHPNVTYCLPVENGGIKNIQDVYK